MIKWLLWIIEIKFKISENKIIFKLDRFIIFLKFKTITNSKKYKIKIKKK